MHMSYVCVCTVYIRHVCYNSVYMEAVKDHVITNVAGGKTVCLKKSNFPNTGKDSAFPSVTVA